MHDTPEPEWRLRPHDSYYAGSDSVETFWGWCERDMAVGHQPGAFYVGAVNWLVSRPGVGKTMVAAHAARVFLDNDPSHRVVWWNYDSGIWDLGQRYIAFGLRDYHEAGRLGVVEGDSDYHPLRNQRGILRHIADDERCLLVLDSVEHSGCPSDGTEIGRWWADHLGRIASDERFTVIALDHLAKAQYSEDGRTYTPIGSQAKMARVSGSIVELRGGGWQRPPVNGGGWTPDQVRGAVDVRIGAKDRLGFVGPPGRDFARVVVGHTVGEDGSPQMTWTVQPPGGRPKGRDARAQVLALLRGGPATTSEIADEIHGYAHVNRLLREMVEDGSIMRPGRGRYMLADLGEF